MANLIRWIEIPVTDLDRAEAFYSSVLHVDLKRMPLGNGLTLSVFATEPDEIGGALALLPSFYHPGQTGPVIYLNATDGVRACLDRAEESGGVVLVPCTQVSSEIGFMGVIRDSEGNRIGLMGSE